MSEFTDELKKLDLAINLPSKTYFAIEEKFKDWQPPMELIEAPKSFDKWYKEIIEKFGVYGKKFAIKHISQYGFGSLLEDVFGETVRDENLLTFADDYESFLSAIVDGYTVKKEQLYYLCEKNTGYYLNKKGDSLNLVVNPYFDDNNEFTQSEIDKLNIGSYEQIAVPVEEN